MRWKKVIKDNKYMKLLVLAPMIIFALTFFILIEKSIPQTTIPPYNTSASYGLPLQHITVITNHGICIKAPCIATPELNLNGWSFFINLIFYGGISIIIYLIINRRENGEN